MNVCVAHLQMNACVAKNFGAWTENVGHPFPTFMAHPTRVGRRVGALHKKLGHPWVKSTNDALSMTSQKNKKAFRYDHLHHAKPNHKDDKLQAFIFSKYFISFTTII